MPEGGAQTTNVPQYVPEGEANAVPVAMDPLYAVGTRQNAPAPVSVAVMLMVNDSGMVAPQTLSAVPPTVTVVPDVDMDHTLVPGKVTVGVPLNVVPTGKTTVALSIAPPPQFPDRFVPVSVNAVGVPVETVVGLIEKLQLFGLESVNVVCAVRPEV